MAKKSALVSRKIALESEEGSDASSHSGSDAAPQTPARKRNKALSKSKPSGATARSKHAASSSSTPKSKKAPAPTKSKSKATRHSPASGSDDGDNGDNDDAQSAVESLSESGSDKYESEVLASPSESSAGSSSDDFDPEEASAPESETSPSKKNRPLPAASTSTRVAGSTTTGSSRAASPLESDLDESDEDIGLNYHAKSVSPKKPKSSSAEKKKKRQSTGTSKKGKGKRKRDDYSDVAPSDEDEEEDEQDVMEVDVRPVKKAKTKASSTTPKKAAPTPKKQPAKRKSKAKESDQEFDEEDEDSDAGRFTVVGKIIQAPTTGRVPPGQISQNTLDFLQHLTKPECNDREWFKLHEPVFRLAEKEWKAFLEELVPMVSDMDEEVPPLPPNDIIHRIYRDIRFSNDKTPYKRNFSASMSRTGRKGKYAGYHISIRPGGSLLAAGIWAPERDSLQNYRANVQHNPAPLREVLAEPDFVEMFGEASPHPKGQRRNVFGNDDELKVAPKGIAKNHPDIDLLKLRSVAVVHHFSDKEVLKPMFNREVVRVMTIMRPLVHVLNQMLVLPADADDGEDD